MPAGSRLQDIFVVDDLVLRAQVMRDRRERWVRPSRRASPCASVPHSAGLQHQFASQMACLDYPMCLGRFAKRIQRHFGRPNRTNLKERQHALQMSAIACYVGP